MALTIEHGSVSRKHAVISFSNGQYIVRDLSSSNGTFVNTHPLSPDKAHVLHPDDTIRFGDVQFRFQLRQQPIGIAASQLVTTQNADETAAKSIPTYSRFIHLSETRAALFQKPFSPPSEKHLLLYSL